MFNKHMGLKLDIFKYINEKLLFLIKIIKRNLHLARVSYGIKKTPFLFFSGKWNYCKNYWSEQLFMTKYLKNWDRSWLLDFTHFTILQRCFLWLLNSHVDLKTYVLVYSLDRSIHEFRDVKNLIVNWWNPIFW